MGKARARVFQSRGRTVAKTPGKTKRQQGVIAIKARLEMKGRQPLVGPIALVMRIGYPIPASWPIWRQNAAVSGTLHPIVKPDIDNVLKLWADALLDIAYVDDTQLVRVQVEKQYQRLPLTICTLQPLTDQPPAGAL